MSGLASARAAGVTLLYACEPAGGAPGAVRAGPARGAPLLELGPGDVLGGTPYVVARRIGQGGMGEVYEVEHRDLGRRFAVKLLHARHRGRPDLAARMRDEARALARLRHPNLVDVFDLGVTADGRTYFAMELLAGRDLRDELARHRVLAVPAALALAAQALAGLAAAHAAGIVHRDVKLENLFLCEDGALKLLDFGVAKILRGGGAITEPDAVVGTPRAMAPEQHAAGPVDPRTDVYAVGLALYELVAGRGPFDDVRGEPHALRFAHCERDPPPPSRLAPHPIPPALDRLVLRALAKAPADRFPSAAAMADAVRALLHDDPGVEDGRRATTAPARGFATPLAWGGEVAWRSASNGAGRPRARPARGAAAPRRRRWRLRPTALAICALVIASAALGSALAERLRAAEPRSAPAAYLGARGEGPARPDPKPRMSTEARAASSVR